MIFNKKFFTYFFTILVVLFPIFNRYSSIIPLVTLSEFFLFLLLFFYLSYIKKIKVLTRFLPLILYLIFNWFAITLLKMELLYDVAGNTVRIVFLYTSVSLLSKNLFDFKLGSKILVYTSIFISIYALFQFFLSFWDIFLTSYIPFLHRMSDYNIDEIIIQRSFYGLTFRPNSLLDEPAHLASYLILPLAIGLLSKEKVNYFFNIFLTFTIFISLSSTGIIITFLLWILYYFKDKTFTKIKILLISSFFSISILLFSSGFLDIFLTRTFGVNFLDFDIFNSTRFSSLNIMMNSNSSLFEFFFGTGLRDLDYYLPGFIRIYYLLGIIGLIVFLYPLLLYFVNGDKFRKNLIFIYIVLNVGTEILLGNFLVFFLPFLIVKKVKPII